MAGKARWQYASSAVSGRTFLLGGAGVLFIVICLLPGAYMFLLSLFGRNGAFTLSNYARLWMEARQRQLLVTSTSLAAGASAIATVIGVPLGLLLARADLPERRLLRVALIVPLVIPPYILALAWIYLTGPTGVVSGLVGRDVLSGLTYSLPAAAIVLGIAFDPLSMLATEAALRRVNGSMEEAGLLIASTGRTFRKITLPVIAPSIAAAALIVFVLAVAEFGVPGLLRVRVYTTEVFTAFAALYDFGRATALTLPLLVVTAVAALLAKWIVGERHLALSRTARPGIPLQLGQAKATVVAILAILIALVVLLPIAVLAANAQQIASSAVASFSAIRNSIVLSIIAATLNVCAGLLLGYARARADIRLGTITDVLFILAFALPSTVVGVGLIGLWNRPWVPVAFYASPAMIVLAYVARFLPVTALILAASVHQVPYSTEEAAEVAGVPWTKSFRRVIVPQIHGGIAAAWVAVFIFAFGELGATVLVTPPGESTLPVRVYTLVANAPASEIASLALIQIIAVLIPLCALAIRLRTAQEKA